MGGGVNILDTATRKEMLQFTRRCSIANLPRRFSGDAAPKCPTNG